MARLHTRNEADLSSATLALLEPTRIGGKIADVYLQFANSEQALSAYLNMEASLRNSGLDDTELEAIKLLVSEITGCEYCLSVHTMKSARAGIDRAMQLSIRRGDDTGNPRLDIILQIVRHFFTARQPVPETMLTAARAEQISDQALVDIAMAVSTIFFTNITNHINDTERTLPAAPAID